MISEVTDFAALKAYTVTTLADQTVLFVKYRAIKDDQGGGFFIYDEALNKAGDEGIFLKPNTPKPSAPNAPWRRLYDGGINVRWYGATGNYTNDTATIQATINAAYNNNINKAGEVIIPQGVYYIDSTLDSYGSITLTGVGNPVFEWAGSTSSLVPLYMISINASSNSTTVFTGLRVVLDSIIFRGNASFAASNFVTNLFATRLYTSSIEIRNCGFHGFDRTTKFETDSYLITFRGCCFRANNYGFSYDYQGLSNSGENISLVSSIVADNNYGIYNNLGQLLVNNCSLDYN